MPINRCAPEQQGVDSNAIRIFLQKAAEQKHELHSFMLLKNGFVIGEGFWKPYAADLPQKLFSLSKSFTSTAIGMAEAEGLLNINDPVGKYFAAEIAALEQEGVTLDEKFKDMTLKHMLTMSTGHDDDPWYMDKMEGDLTRSFLKAPLKGAPGSFFMYNTHATYMLSVILQKLTGQTLTQYLTPRLFEPLQIASPFWEQSPNGYDFGGFGLNLVTEDVAKLGQLYLQKGVWEGKRLFAEYWANDATAKQVETKTSRSGTWGIDWACGYGYQFWQCQHGAFRGDGAFGQYCIVIPQANAVLVMTSNTKMQPVMDLVWDYLLPALTAENCKAEGGEAYRALQTECQTLSLLKATENGILPENHVLRRFPRLTFPLQIDSKTENAPKRIKLEYVQKRKELLLSFWVSQAKDAPPLVLRCREGQWTDGLCAYPYGEHCAQVVAFAQWPDDNSLRIMIRYPATPFTLLLNLNLTEESDQRIALAGDIQVYDLIDQPHHVFQGKSV